MKALTLRILMLVKLFALMLTLLSPLQALCCESIGTFYLTAYCSCSRCCGGYASDRPVDENGNQIVYTATGTVAEPGRTVSVDPAVIPLGSEILINGHRYVAEDTGVSGRVIDVYFSNHEDALIFGSQKGEVKVVKVR